jgi:hypothetical protein
MIDFSRLKCLRSSAAKFGANGLPNSVNGKPSAFILSGSDLNRPLNSVHDALHGTD